MGIQHNPVATEHELGEIRALVERQSGILFEGSRERLLATRVGEHLGAKKMAHGSELLRAILASNVEYEELLERLLTQETSFFRYPDVFHALQNHVLPELHLRKLWTSPRALRVWSAGCATGEEPYSIAMTMVETLESPDAWVLSVLATDISRAALQQAERGVYSARQLAGLPAARLENHFTPVGGQYLIRPRIRNLVSFAPFNLVDQVYPGRFDCIFCMNVLIYFSEPQRTAIIERLQDYLEPGGFLFLGHAETLSGAKVNLRTIVHRDARVYQKPERALATDAGAGTHAGRSAR